MKTKLYIAALSFAAAACLLGVMCFSANADNAFERSSLVGLQGVHVVVEKTNPQITLESLTKPALQRDIEAMIAASGIKVLTQKQMLDTAGMPYLYINVSTAKGGNFYAYHINIQLRQGVYLERDNKLAVTAVTWDGTGITGMVSESELTLVRTFVDEGVREFIKAYMSANPKI